MLFLDKLDPQRYAGILAHLINDATLGRPIPRTLHAAWSTASGWKTANTKIARGSDMQSVFLLADDAAQAGTPRNPKTGRGSKSPNRSKITTWLTRLCLQVVEHRRNTRDKRHTLAEDASSKVTGTATAPTTMIAHQLKTR